jgi:hypothetical protein
VAGCWCGLATDNNMALSKKGEICIIVIIIYLSWSWVTCWPVPVSRVQKSLQRSAMIPSANRGVVFHIIYNHIIYYEAFCLRVVSSFSCILVVCPKLELFLTRLQFVYLFCNCRSVPCCSSHVLHLCCWCSYSVTCFNMHRFKTKIDRTSFGVPCFNMHRFKTKIDRTSFPHTYFVCEILYLNFILTVLWDLIRSYSSYLPEINF